MFTTTVTFETATGPGALDGYRVVCSCGFSAKNIFERQARKDAVDHEEWHAKRAAVTVPATANPRKAKRHYCLSGALGQGGITHTSGNGAARIKKCAYCRGTVVTVEGFHGVFIWTGDGRYPAENAVRLFSSIVAAEKFAKTDSRYVVRWL